MDKKLTVLFVVTNGAGLGHLTRGLAVAKRLRKLDCSLNIIFFTTSLATEVIRNEGFMYFYIPTKTLYPGGMTTHKWGEMMERHLEEIIELYNPCMIVYDGAMPYGAVILELKKHHTMRSVWIKRESYKKGWESLNTLEGNFDKIIIPREIGEDKQREENIHVTYCNPITFLDKEEAHSRETVRNALGVKEEEQLFYIQLGAGNINDIKEDLIKIQRSLYKRPKIKIILAESIIGKPIKPLYKDIIQLKSFPNSQYFKGIDFAISAAGYNTFHELIQFQIPTLFIPNLYTQIDDQKRRVMNLENKGASLRLQNSEELEDKLQQLIDKKELLKKNISHYQMENGALKAARIVYDALG